VCGSSGRARAAARGQTAARRAARVRAGASGGRAPRAASARRAAGGARGSRDPARAHARPPPRRADRQPPPASTQPPAPTQPPAATQPTWAVAAADRTRVRGRSFSAAGERERQERVRAVRGARWTSVRARTREPEITHSTSTKTSCPPRICGIFATNLRPRRTWAGISLACRARHGCVKHGDGAVDGMSVRRPRVIRVAHASTSPS
jgi:hypothetical protein